MMQRRRLSRLVALAAVLVSMLVGCSRTVSGIGQPARPPEGASISPSPGGSGSAGGSGSSAGSGGAGGSSTPAPSGSTQPPRPASCPSVHDTKAGVRFTCLVASMITYSSNFYTTAQIAQTESDPDWFMSQYIDTIAPASTAAALAAAVAAQLAAFTQTDYPTGSTAAVTTTRPSSVGGRPALYVAGLITVDKSDPTYAALKVKQDRVVIQGWVRTDGVATLLTMAVPDTRKDLWPGMDRIAATVVLK